MKSSVARKTTAQEKSCLVCETNDCSYWGVYRETAMSLLSCLWEIIWLISDEARTFDKGLNIIPKYLICQKLKKNNLSDFRVGWDLLQDPAKYVHGSCWEVQVSLLRVISIIGKEKKRGRGEAALEVLSEFNTKESEGAGVKYTGWKGCACAFLTGLSMHCSLAQHLWHS